MIESMKEDIVRHHAHLLRCLLDENVTIVSSKTNEELIRQLADSLREIFTSAEAYRDFLRRELHERFGEDVYDPNHFIAVHKNQLRGESAPAPQCSPADAARQAIVIEWSTDRTDWHDAARSTDRYVRMSYDGGQTWQKSVQLKREESAIEPLIACASIGETPSDIASLIESAAKYGYSVNITAYPPSTEEDDDPTRP